MSGQKGKVAARPGLLGALNMAHADRRNWTNRPKMRWFSKWKEEESKNWNPAWREIMCNCLYLRWLIFQKNQFFRRYDFYRTVPPEYDRWFKPKNMLNFMIMIGALVAMVLSTLARNGDNWLYGSNLRTHFIAPYFPVGAATIGLILVPHSLVLAIPRGHPFPSSPSNPTLSIFLD